MLYLWKELLMLWIVDENIKNKNTINLIVFLFLTNIINNYIYYYYKLNNVFSILKKILGAFMNDLFFRDNLFRIISEYLCVKEETLTLTTNLVDDLGADSLDLIEIFMAIDLTFDIKTSDEEIVNFLIIQNIISKIEKNNHTNP